MREIKFRAWDGRRFVYSFTKKGQDRLGWFFSAMPGFKKEQFTGLNDKNCKEIYGGDIVKGRTNYFPRVNLEGVVVFEDAEYLIEQNDDSFPLCSFHVVDRLAIEVIGNIHENKDLLEVLS